MAKKPKPKTVFYRRIFLNRPTYFSQAFFYGWITENDEEPYFKLGDCDRHIVMTLYKHTKAHRANSLRKMDLLYQAVRDFRLALYKSWGVEPKDI